MDWFMVAGIIILAVGMWLIGSTIKFVLQALEHISRQVERVNLDLRKIAENLK